MNSINGQPDSYRAERSPSRSAALPFSAKGKEGDMSNQELPDPIVPPEVDLRDFAFMPLDVVRLRDSGLTAKASGDEFRAAVLLWCASWHQKPAASLPDDDQELANLCGYGRAPKEWKKIRAGALHGWMKCSDGRLYHPIVGEKACDAWASKLAQRARTEAARKAREEARQKQQQAMSQPLSQTPEASVTDDVTASKGQGQGQGQGQGDSVERGGARGGDPEAPLAPPSATPTPKASTACRLPKDWQLPKAWGEWALSERPDWTADKVRKVAEAFRDHWLSKGGADARKADWLATWRNWVRREQSAPSRGASVLPMTPGAAAKLAAARTIFGTEIEGSGHASTGRVIDITPTAGALGCENFF